MIYLLNKDMVRIPNKEMHFAEEWRINKGDVIRWDGDNYQVVRKEFTESMNTAYGEVILYVQLSNFSISSDMEAFKKAVADGEHFQ